MATLHFALSDSAEAGPDILGSLQFFYCLSIAMLCSSSSSSSSSSFFFFVSSFFFLLLLFITIYLCFSVLLIFPFN